LRGGYYVKIHIAKQHMKVEAIGLYLKKGSFLCYYTLMCEISS